MKKWIVVALIVCVAGFVQAAEKKGKGAGKPVNKEQFCAQMKKNMEKQGKTFDQAKIEKRFDQLDKDGDGKLSAEEKKAGMKGKGKKK
ncbi:MAG: hypothetical protein K9M45_09630 [Kiritimatiellales bacterium]|nr:hypothetical protein [Kiritimatiellales bacterium]